MVHVCICKDKQRPKLGLWHLPTTPFNPSLQGCVPSSFVAEVVIFFFVPLSQHSSFYSFVPEAVWCCSLHPSSHFVNIMFFSLLIRLAGVLCPLLKFFYLIKSCISFQPECLHVLLVHCYHFLMSFNLQGSHNVACSLCLTECFQSCSSPLYSLFQFVKPPKVRGFTRLSKKQLCFTSSSSVSLRCHPRSRDEILL